MTTKTSPVEARKPSFKKHVRFDPTKANDGVPHHIVDENGNDYGVWTTRLFDVHNKELKVLNDRYEREFSKDANAKGKNGGLYAFVRVCLVGYDVEDEDGNKMPFDAETAFEHLCDEDNSWFTNELIERSKDVRYYRALTPAATKEEDAGN